VVEYAYESYRQGLARFTHPPLEHLKTPVTFSYYPPPAPSEGTGEQSPLANPERECYWVGKTLVLNQGIIGPQPEQSDLLLPLLARLLHDSHSPIREVELLFHLATLAQGLFVCRLMLWPVLDVAKGGHERWQALERDRVLDRDRFAYWCGQGWRLRKLLRRQLDTLKQHHQPDNAVPTLAERLDHLDSLLGPEARLVQKLLAALPPAVAQRDEHKAP
jgi:hypothetical protein